MKRDVLDKGFVRLVDSMGDDSSIVQAARVSYGATPVLSKREQEEFTVKAGKLGFHI